MSENLAGLVAIQFATQPKCGADYRKRVCELLHD